MSAPPSSSLSSLPSAGMSLSAPRVGGCIEFMVAAADSSVPFPPHVLNHWMQQLSERITTMGGSAQAVQPNVLWFGFGGQEPALALRRALKVVWPVLQQPAQFQGIQVPMRMALALEKPAEAGVGDANDPDVFTCRAQAQAGQCVMSSALASWLPNGLPTQRLANGLVALVPPPVVAPTPAAPAVPATPPPVNKPLPVSSAAVSQEPQPVAAPPAPPLRRSVVVAPPPQVLSQPATPPTIPEVVLQRFSAPLPDEPAASGLHVYADLMGSGSWLSPSVASTSNDEPTVGISSALPPSLVQEPPPSVPLLPVSELQVNWPLPQCFASLASPPAPTHRYADCPNALLAAIHQGL